MYYEESYIKLIINQNQILQDKNVSKNDSICGSLKNKCRKTY